MQERSYSAVRRHHCEVQLGIFPVDDAFIDTFADWHAGHVAQLDCLGVFGAAREQDIVEHYAFDAALMPYGMLRPDRTRAGPPGPCYLPSLAGRRVLIVASFAPLLAARATAEIYEAVWAKIGKRWFAPRSVAALDFPYGFAGSDHRGFATSIDVFDDIARRMAAVDFDVALIGSGGLGIPIAAEAKRLGRVGISLGGELQILFGVKGGRWRDDPSWQRKYFTDAWIDMPPRFHPPGKQRLADRGAYW
ncbi:MAG: hypothetical protein KIT16_06945 [Rhodospirillaceae bacterium]|nr:hypothetical protein [Rhodospirillaceae bacterium]